MNKIDRQVLRRVLTQNPNLTSFQLAEEYTRLTGQGVKPATIRVLTARYRDEWGLTSRPMGARREVHYKFTEHLGTISPRHIDDWDYVMLAAYERLQDGRLRAKDPYGVHATNYTAVRTTTGRVTDYSPRDGFRVRLAMPWELGSPHALTPVKNAVARTRLILAALGQDLTYETPGGRAVALTPGHAEAWYEFLAKEGVAP